MKHLWLVLALTACAHFKADPWLPVGSMATVLVINGSADTAYAYVLAKNDTTLHFAKDSLGNPEGIAPGTMRCERIGLLEQPLQFHVHVGPNMFSTEWFQVDKPQGYIIEFDRFLHFMFRPYANCAA